MTSLLHKINRRYEVSHLGATSPPYVTKIVTLAKFLQKFLKDLVRKCKKENHFKNLNLAKILQVLHFLLRIIQKMHKSCKFLTKTEQMELFDQIVQILTVPIYKTNCVRTEKDRIFHEQVLARLFHSVQRTARFLNIAIHCKQCCV